MSVYRYWRLRQDQWLFLCQQALELCSPARAVEQWDEMHWWCSLSSFFPALFFVFFFLFFKGVGCFFLHNGSCPQGEELKA